MNKIILFFVIVIVAVALWLSSSCNGKPPATVEIFETPVIIATLPIFIPPTSTVEFISPISDPTIEIEDGVTLTATVEFVSIITTTIESTPTPFETPIPKLGGFFIIIYQGDTLWGFADTFYDKGWLWTIIFEESTLSDPNLIHPGNRLYIPEYFPVD